MFILVEQARHSLKEAITKEKINGLTEHKLLSEAFEAIIIAKKETSFDAFTQRCEWVAGTLIPGVSILAKTLLENPNFSDMKIEVCSDGKLLLDNINITGSTKTFILMYLSFIFSINDATTPTGAMQGPDENILVLVQQTIVLYKELIRQCYINNTVYGFDLGIINKFNERLLMKNMQKSVAMSIATLGMLLLVDINFCDSNSMILLLLSRATKCLKSAMIPYMTTFVISSGEYLGANTEYLANTISRMLVRNQAVTLND